MTVDCNVLSFDKELVRFLVLFESRQAIYRGEMNYQCEKGFITVKM